MNNKMFSIGEMSEITGITIKALRFYERIGLVKPHYKDPSTKYRYYSMEQFIRLDIIKAARSMGISPNDIRAILDKGDNDLLLEFLSRQKRNAAEKILELQTTMSMIDMAQNNIRDSVSSVLYHDVYIKEIPSRSIVAVELDKNISEGDILSGYSKIFKLIDGYKLINAYETGIILTPDEKQEFHPTQVYNTIMADSGSDTTSLSAIQAGRFLCVCYNKQNVLEQQNKFNVYFKQNKLNPALLLQVDLLNDVFACDGRYVELQALIPPDSENSKRGRFLL